MCSVHAEGHHGHRHGASASGSRTDEPNYPGAAKELGPEALPYLERIITGDHTGLAAKAAYLAGLIGTPESLSVLDKAARSSEPAMRIAAASAARHLSTDQSDSLLLQLVDDADGGVRKWLAVRVQCDVGRAQGARRGNGARGPHAGPAFGRGTPGASAGEESGQTRDQETRAAGGAKKKRRPAGRAAKKARQRR